MCVLSLHLLPPCSSSSVPVKELTQSRVDRVDDLRLAAERGDADAAWLMGKQYANGRGVTRDDSEAARWYRVAAEQDDPLAQHKLGKMYADGVGVSQDFVEAARWFRLVAEQGDAEAQIYLGSMYALGRGVPQDDVLAYAWLNLAAAGLSGSMRENAAQFRDLARAVLTREQVAEGQRLSRELADHIQSRRGG